MNIFSLEAVAFVDKKIHGGIKKNVIMKFAGKWINENSIILSMVSPTQKEKCNTLSVLCRS